MTNQTVQEMYMGRGRCEVALSNNICIIDNELFVFEMENLIILNDKDKILLLQLYDEKIKNTKFVKYHFSNEHAVFFFHYRYSNFQNCHCLEGVYFFVLISRQALELKILNNKSLIDDKTLIYIMKSHKEIEQTKFDEELLKSKCSNDKYTNGSYNELIFEVTRDLSDPI